jgi:hypothetical protein
MWGPGSITYAVVIIWALYRWLDDEEASARRRRRTHAVRQSPA